MGREVWLLVRPDGIAVDRLIYDPETSGEAPAGLAWMPDDGRVVVPRDNEDTAGGKTPALRPSRIKSPLDFRRRFTALERSAITLAAHAALGQGWSMLQEFMDDLSSAQEVSLDSADLREGMDLLVHYDLLTADRAAAILAD